MQRSKFRESQELGTQRARSVEIIGCRERIALTYVRACATVLSSPEVTNVISHRETSWCEVPTIARP